MTHSGNNYFGHTLRMTLISQRAYIVHVWSSRIQSLQRDSVLGLATCGPRGNSKPFGEMQDASAEIFVYRTHCSIIFDLIFIQIREALSVQNL